MDLTRKTKAIKKDKPCKKEKEEKLKKGQKRVCPRVTKKGLNSAEKLESPAKKFFSHTFSKSRYSVNSEVDSETSTMSHEFPTPPKPFWGANL